MRSNAGRSSCSVLRARADLYLPTIVLPERTPLCKHRGIFSHSFLWRCTSEPGHRPDRWKGSGRKDNPRSQPDVLVALRSRVTPDRSWASRPCQALKRGYQRSAPVKRVTRQSHRYKPTISASPTVATVQIPEKHLAKPIFFCRFTKLLSVTADYTTSRSPCYRLPNGNELQ